MLYDTLVAVWIPWPFASCLSKKQLFGPPSAKPIGVDAKMGLPRTALHMSSGLPFLRQPWILRRIMSSFWMGFLVPRWGWISPLATRLARKNCSGWAASSESESLPQGNAMIRQSLLGPTQPPITRPGRSIGPSDLQRKWLGEGSHYSNRWETRPRPQILSQGKKVQPGWAAGVHGYCYRQLPSSSSYHSNQVLLAEVTTLLQACSVEKHNASNTLYRLIMMLKFAIPR